MSETHEELPYVVRCNPEWKDEIESWDWKSDGPDRWVKSGTCPNCHAPLDVVAERGPIGLERVGIDAICACGLPHKGRPDDAIFAGCGLVCQVTPPRNG